MTAEVILQELESLRNPGNLEGMKKFGVNVEKAFGINIPTLRNIAKRFRKNHELALSLWSTGYHEARILTAFVDDSKLVTTQQMDAWVQDFNSWDLCDQCCGNLFDRTPYAFEKALEWANKEEEFVKRAGFVMMASLAVHDKKSEDEAFENFFPLIIEKSNDNRNFVKKGVSWALRQIGKRNTALNRKAILCAEEIKKLPYKPSKWIASNALRELTSEKIVRSLR